MLTSAAVHHLLLAADVPKASCAWGWLSPCLCVLQWVLHASPNTAAGKYTSTQRIIVSGALDALAAVLQVGRSHHICSFDTQACTNPAADTGCFDICPTAGVLHRPIASMQQRRAACVICRWRHAATCEARAVCWQHMLTAAALRPGCFMLRSQCSRPQRWPVLPLRLARQSLTPPLLSCLGALCDVGTRQMMCVGHSEAL